MIGYTRYVPGIYLVYDKIDFPNTVYVFILLNGLYVFYQYVQYIEKNETVPYENIL
jgi:hypothetical protein